VKSVAYSEGWPNWLRLALLRPIAYAAGHDYGLPNEPLAALRRDNDRVIVLWTAFVQVAEHSEEAPSAREFLERAAGGPSAERELADLLVQALDATGTERDRLLGEATEWTRVHHEDTAKLWAGWELRANELVSRPHS
jgi:hypothetical protein